MKTQNQQLSAKEFDTEDKVTNPFTLETAQISSQQLLKSHRKIVESDLAALTLTFEQTCDVGLPDFYQSELSAVINTIVHSPGKRVRPLIAHWFAHFFATNESEIKQILSVGTAVEVLHAASLVIDDIQDGSLERRGEATVAAKVGMPTALNTASLCYFLAVSHFPTIETKYLANATLIKCHLGQGLDLMSDHIDHAKSWLSMSAEKQNTFYAQSAELKTATLIKLVGQCVGSILRKPEAWQKKVDGIFLSYGLLFQWIDDLKNLSPALSGTKAYEDLRVPVRNKVFLVFFQSLSIEDQSFFSKRLQESDSEDLKNDICGHHLFKTAIQKCVAMAGDLSEQIQREIQDLCEAEDWPKLNEGPETSSHCKSYLQSLFQTQYDVLKAFAQ